MTRAPNPERGASLLSVLVIVMLMSVAAITATDALARSVIIAKASGVRTETFWTARGAATATGAYLATAIQLSGSRLTLDSELLDQQVTLPAGHGRVEINVREASNCFNLNTLTDATEEADLASEPLKRYVDLLVAAGFNEAEAESLGEKLMDWIDPDLSTRTYGAEDGFYVSQAEPYRTAGRKLRSVSELRAIVGYDARSLSIVEPLVCLRPVSQQAPLNLNTLTVEQAPLLASLYSSELSVDDARTLIEERPTGGWADLEAFQSEDPIMRILPEARNDQALSIGSSYLAADMSIGTGDLVTSYRAIYALTADDNVQQVLLVRRDF